MRDDCAGVTLGAIPAHHGFAVKLHVTASVRSAAADLLSGHAA